MHIFLFAGWWQSLSIDIHIFLSISIVFSTLLIILFILSYFRLDTDTELSAEQSRERNWYLNAKYIIAFFTLFGWSGIVMAFLWDHLSLTFLYSFIIGLTGTLFFRWLSSSSPIRKNFHMEKALASTGKVLSSIPPHRNGFGKVHLNIREAPFEIDAVTAGQEVPKGTPVRVVDILDDKIVLVEPISGKGHRHRRNFEQKATRSSTKFLFKGPKDLPEK